MGALTRFNATLARYGMYFAVAGLLLIVATVAWQVFGRYVLHNPPTWAIGIYTSCVRVHEGGPKPRASRANCAISSGE